MKIQNLNALFLALAPILAVYTFSNGILLYFIIILVLFALNIFSGNVLSAITIRKNEVQWYIAIVLVGLLGFICNSSNGFFDNSLFVNNFIALTLFFIALILCSSLCNVTLFKKTILWFGVAAALICIFQRMQLLWTGYFYKEFFLPGLEVKRDLDTFSINRVSAFFTEPAHLSIYIIPIFYIALNEGRKFVAMMLATGVLFSGSTTGFVLVAILTVIYIISVSQKLIYILYALIAIVGLYIGVMCFFPDVLIDNVEKLNTTDSGSVRLLGPLQYLDLFDPLQWLFGVGLNQFANFLSHFGIYVQNEWGVEKNANYASGVIYMLLCYGITGFIFFIRYLYKSIKLNSSNIGFVVYTLGILLSDQVLFNMNLLYILTFIILSKKITREC